MGSTRPSGWTSRSRWRSGAGLFGVWVAMCGDARRADAQQDVVTRRECMRAYEDSQLQRRSQELLKAREALRVCSAEACPSLARTDCMTWLSEIDATIPTVVFEGRADDRAVFDVTVEVDGKVVATNLDGRPVEVDPGLHTLTFQRADRPKLEQKIILREGDKSRRVVADWTEGTPPPPTPTSSPSSSPPLDRIDRPVPVSVLLLAGVGIAGAADFLVAGLLGNAKKSDLDASGCAPFCPADQVSAVKTRYLVADIGLGASAAAFAAGGILFAMRPERLSHGGPVASFGISPVGSGALAACHVEF